MKRCLILALILCLTCSVALAEEEQPKSVLDSIGGWFNQAAEDMSSWVSQAWSDASKWVEGAWGDASKWVEQAWNDSSTWAVEIWGDVSTWAVDTYDNASGAVSSWWTETFKNVTESKTDAWSWIAEESASLDAAFREELTAIQSAINNEIQLYDVLMQGAKKREERMMITCGNSYSLDQLQNDLRQITDMLGINKYWLRDVDSEKGSAVLHFEYRDSFRICESLADIYDYIDECAETNEQDVNIYIARNYSYQCFADNHYELDYALANSRLKYPGEYYYIEENNLISYSTFDTVEYIPRGKTEDRFAFSLPDLLRIYDKLSSSLTRRYSIFVSEDVLTQIQSSTRSGEINRDGESVNLLSDIKSNNGILHRSLSNPRINYHWIYHSNVPYYPGQEIAYAYKNNQTDELSEIYQRTLAAALQIVEGLTGDDLHRVRQIHDRLCRKIRYSETNTGRSGQSLAFPDTQNAIGALVYGHSVCEGYADAFYLCCSLENIDVKYIVGMGNSNNEIPNRCTIAAYR